MPEATARERHAFALAFLDEMAGDPPVLTQDEKDTVRAVMSLLAAMSYIPRDDVDLSCAVMDLGMFAARLGVYLAKREELCQS